MQTLLRTFACSYFIWLVVLNPAYALEPREGDVFVRVIDVGAGLSCVIKMPDGHFMIYDAGDKGRAINQISEIIPQQSKIDLLVLSHSDADHLGAVPFICQEYLVLRAIHSGLRKPSSNIPSHPTKDWAEAMTALAKEKKKEGCDVISLKKQPLIPGNTYQIGEVKVVMVYGLHKPPPQWGFSTTKHTSEYYNSGSIVVRLEYKGKSVLFCGDTVGRHIGTPSESCIAAEAAMVANAGSIEIDSDVIIAPHHGADNGSSSDFIEKVSPKYVIFSAGSEFYHPRKSVAERYMTNGVAKENIFRTDRHDKFQGKTEWAGQVLAYNDEKSKTDHVDIVIRKNGELIVDYSIPAN